MNKRTLRAAALCPALLVLGGCSALGINFTDDKVQYEASNTRANLEVPPDLAPVANENRFEVPSRPGVVSANTEMARAQVAGEATQERGSIVQRTVVAKLMRDGNERWLRVNADAEPLWTVVTDFWPSVGLTIRRQDAKTGYLETEWAENKAKLPQDIIRGTIGKVLDVVYDTGERDQYRARMERNDDGTCDIYITHKQMVEVLKGKQEDSTIWQPGPSDPQLEAEMLTRLAQKLETEFNPAAKPEEQRALDALAAVKYVPVSEVVKAADGTPEAVVISEPFDRAWRRVGVALDRAGFDITDRDRREGLIMVKYLDPDYEKEAKKAQGFFSNMFGKGSAVDPVPYQIRLTPEGDSTRVTVSGADGKVDTTGVAPRIVNLIGEQTR